MATGNHLMVAVVFACLATTSVLGCAGTEPTVGKEDRPALPFGLNSIYLGMSKAELLAKRPSAKLGDSSNAYGEKLAEGPPLVSWATYVLEGDRLTEVSLDCGFASDKWAEMDDLIPGVLAGAHELWGEPDEVDVVAYPNFKDRTYWQVHLIWRKGQASIMLDYTPSVTNQVKLRREDHTPSEIRMTLLSTAMSRERTEALRMHRGDEPTSQYFNGFPMPGSVKGWIMK